MPEGQGRSWSKEPWHATMNGTIYCDEGPIGDMDDPEKPDPSYASDLDVANAARCVACVNAMEGLSNPGALPDVLASGREIHDFARALSRSLSPEAAAELGRHLTALSDAMARLEGLRGG